MKRCNRKMLDEILIYENYFKTQYDVIHQMLELYLLKGKKVALWGAGARGKAFLNVYDPDHRFIACIYDKNESRFGEVFETGHCICDFRNEPADIVIVANNTFEYKTLRTLRAAQIMSEVINVDSIILGNQSLDEALGGTRLNLEKTRECRILAIVIGYHPDQEVVQNVLSYASQVEKVIFHDNSEYPDAEIERALEKEKNITYYANGMNEGLCVPFNRYIKYAIAEKYDFFLTFDQDSKPEKNMIPLMKQYAESASCKADVGIICPTINEADESDIIQESEITYCDKVYQSGAMHRVSMMQEIGDFDENLFIDEVDHDYCVRARLQGYKIVRINKALLLHNREDREVKEAFIDGKDMFIGKYSAARYYYRYRNAMYCFEKYQNRDPIYALVCQNVIKKINIGVENEVNKKIIQDAIEKAERDYQNGNFGGNF